MARRVLPIWLGLFTLAALSGCGFYERAQRPEWRAQAENACLAKKLIQTSAFIRPMSEISGPGICGLEHPFKVSALANGAVALTEPQTMDCSMIAEVDQWLGDVVQPAAQARFGQPVAAMSLMGSYSCRSVDNIPGAKLSEHSFANAVDVGSFKLADGRDIIVVRDWKKSDSQESAFLKEVHGGACQRFTTVLGPGADVYHYNHIHMDLAMHGNTNTGPRRYCKPAMPASLTPPPGVQDGLPPAPEIDEQLDISSAPPRSQASAGMMAQGNLSGALPPAVRLYSGRAGAPLDLSNASAVEPDPDATMTIPAR